MTLTVRELVRGYQAEIDQTPDLSPSRAAEIELKLQCLSGNCREEILKAECAYNLVYKGCLETAKSANQAKIYAATTDEWRRWQEARNVFSLILRLTTGLRDYLRHCGEEMRLTR